MSIFVEINIERDRCRPSRRVAFVAMELRCCGPDATVGEPLEEDAAIELADLLKVLADPVRLRLLSLIARSPGAEVCACDLVDAVDRSQPTISHHLKVLHEAGVLGRERRGSWVHYSLGSDAVDAVCDALALVCTPVPVDA